MRLSASGSALQGVSTLNVTAGSIYSWSGPCRDSKESRRNAICCLSRCRRSISSISRSERKVVIPSVPFFAISQHRPPKTDRHHHDFGRFNT